MSDTKATVGVSFITSQTGQRPQAIYNMMKSGSIPFVVETFVSADGNESVARKRIPREFAEFYVRRYLARRAADESARS